MSKQLIFELFRQEKSLTISEYIDVAKRNGLMFDCFKYENARALKEVFYGNWESVGNDRNEGETKRKNRSRYNLTT